MRVLVFHSHHQMRPTIEYWEAGANRRAAFSRVVVRRVPWEP